MQIASSHTGSPGAYTPRRKGSSSSLSRSIKVNISYTEVYNEVVYDLLDSRQRDLPIEKRKSVQILEGPDGGLILRNVNLYEVSQESDGMCLYLYICMYICICTYVCMYVYI